MDLKVRGRLTVAPCLFLDMFRFLAGWTLIACCMACTTQQRDWRDEVLYFAMIDRLANGDLENDDQGEGEWDVTRDSHFHGGDLAGVLQVLDGIEALGATGLWLTPPVHNQWWNPGHSHTGYHGYWATDFESVDPHFGDMADWRAVADALHARNMILIQDVVVNHTADWVLTDENGSRVRDWPVADWLTPDSSRYHWNPEITDYTNERQVHTFELAGLDDLKTERPWVRQRLRKIYKDWLEVGGADGFRFDTHKYVEDAFWPAFLEGESGDLGVRSFAHALGKSFPNFGEVWTHSEPLGQEGELEMIRYLRRPGYEGVDAVLNFPLQESLLRVFGEGQNPADLAHRITLQHRLFDEPAMQLVNFIDNHDMARFRSTASEEGTRQALNSLLSLPGVPVIYQGTEQADISPRQNLFGRFDMESEHFQWLQEAIAWRKANPTVSRGQLIEAGVVPNTPLVHWSLAYESDTVRVLCNPTRDTIVVGVGPDSIPLRSPLFSRQQGDCLLHYAGDDMAFAACGPHAWVAWSKWSDEVPTLGSMGRVRSDSYVDGIRFTNIHEQGMSNGTHLIQQIHYDAAGFVSGWDAGMLREIDHPRVLLAHGVDPCEDDRGLDGTLLPPTSSGFERSMDLGEVSVYREGPDLVIEMNMCAGWSVQWNPRFGFDHVAFEVTLWDAQRATCLAKWRHSGWSLQPLVGWVPESDGVRADQLTWRLPIGDFSQELFLQVDSWDADGNGEWRKMEVLPGPFHMGGFSEHAIAVMDRLELKIPTAWKP